MKEWKEVEESSFEKDGSLKISLVEINSNSQSSSMIHLLIPLRYPDIPLDFKIPNQTVEFMNGLDEKMRNGFRKLKVEKNFPTISDSLSLWYSTLHQWNQQPH